MARKDGKSAEEIFRTISHMEEMGPQNDELSQLIADTGLAQNGELPLEDLDLVAAASGNPNYQRFLEFALGKDKK